MTLAALRLHCLRSRRGRMLLLPRATRWRRRWRSLGLVQDMRRLPPSQWRIE